MHHVTINPVDELECISCSSSNFIMFCYTCEVCGSMYYLCRACSGFAGGTRHLVADGDNSGDIGMCNACNRDKQIDIWIE